MELGDCDIARVRGLYSATQPPRNRATSLPLLHFLQTLYQLRTPGPRLLNDGGRCVIDELFIRQPGLGCGQLLLGLLNFPRAAFELFLRDDALGELDGNGKSLDD